MLTDADVALTRIAEQAYLTQPNGQPAGFYPVQLSALGLTVGPEETYTDGEYTARNAGALVLVGTLDGKTTAVLSFRGSVNEQDSINDLQDINRQYGLFGHLIAAFDAWVARQGISQVAVTGHSLGGAMAQIYMQMHPNTATTSYVSDTFGSPGALIAPDGDTRITAVQVADDPAVYLGENRAAVGNQLQTDPALAAAAVFAGPEVFPGLTSLDVINSIPDLNQNYVNNGVVALLPDADGSYATVNGVISAATVGKSEHLITTYLPRIEGVTGATGDGQVLPDIVPTTVGQQVYRFFDTSNGTHLFTTSAVEKNQIQATLPDYSFEGVGLNATLPPAQDPHSVPVFRFFNTSDGEHFLTDSTAEQGTLLSAGPTWSYEGVAFYEHATAQPGDSAVYRFFDTQNGTHFYTASSNESALVLATRGDLQSEGVAFYTLSA